MACEGCRKRKEKMHKAWRELKAKAKAAWLAKQVKK